MRLEVFARSAVGPDDSPASLTAGERRQLEQLGYAGLRRREWIAGRLAAHHLLRTWLGPDRPLPDVLGDPDGAPRLRGGPPASVSLSHDGDWIAVALAEGNGVRAGVDVCARANASRLLPILCRLGIDGVGVAEGGGAGLHPCVAWAALECALKLRRLGISTLLATPRLAVTVDPSGEGRRAQVRGLGPASRVSIALTRSYALAWGCETEVAA